RLKHRAPRVHQRRAWIRSASTAPPFDTMHISIVRSAGRPPALSPASGRGSPAGGPALRRRSVEGADPLPWPAPPCTLSSAPAKGQKGEFVQSVAARMRPPPLD